MIECLQNFEELFNEMASFDWGITKFPEYFQIFIYSCPHSIENGAPLIVFGFVLRALT